MDENAIKLEARLTAIELLLVNAFQISYRLANASDQDVQASHDRILEILQTDSVTGLDPALSDLWSAELEVAVRRLLSLLSHMRASD